MFKMLRKMIGARDSTQAPEQEGPKSSATGDVLSGRARVQPPPAKRDASPDAASGQDFDPYNTGAFNRSASWERISKR